MPFPRNNFVFLSMASLLSELLFRTGAFAVRAPKASSHSRHNFVFDIQSKKQLI
eukprot:GDKH01002999.1.p3 GENE.GDKH01002999.1~~GDKH01002999.1.p3  ORF type:complete len:54 (-),score=3.32 GDKH01002999.1:28-189(-)